MYLQYTIIHISRHPHTGYMYVCIYIYTQQNHLWGRLKMQPQCMATPIVSDAGFNGIYRYGYIDK